jgi:hypothetical protein
VDLEVINRSEDNGRASVGISLWSVIFEILTLEILMKKGVMIFSLIVKVNSGD